MMVPFFPFTNTILPVVLLKWRNSSMLPDLLSDITLLVLQGAAKHLHVNFKQGVSSENKYIFGSTFINTLACFVFVIFYTISTISYS